MPRQKPPKQEPRAETQWLPGATEAEPYSKPYLSGWPQELSDVDGIKYWRLRDGSPTSDYGGASVLYGKIVLKGEDKPIVLGDYQYTPTIGSGKTDNVTFSGGVWMWNTDPPLEETFSVQPTTPVEGEPG